MTSKQQRQEFIKHVRESAKSLFLPPTSGNEADDANALYHMWLHNIERELIGTMIRHPATGNLYFANGPCSMATIASKIELFDDLADRPPGVEIGEGYTDGAALFVPLSKFKSLIANQAKAFEVAAWIEDGLRVHAGHLVGKEEFHTSAWRVLGRPIYPPARDGMIHALSKANLSGGPWLSVWGKAVHESKARQIDLAQPGIAPRLRMFDAALKKSYEGAASSENKEDRAQVERADLARVAKESGRKPSNMHLEFRIQEYAGTWLMENYAKTGLGWADFSFAVIMCAGAFSGQSLSGFGNEGLGERFIRGLQRSPSWTPALAFIAKSALLRSQFVSPLYPDNFKDAGIYMKAQANLLDPGVSARALAEAIIDIQLIDARKTPVPGLMSYSEIMRALPLLTRGADMSEDMLMHAAQHAPHVAVEWASRNVSKLKDPKSKILKYLTEALISNKMGYSDDERIEIINRFMDLDQGRVYAQLHTKKLFVGDYGFHHILISEQPWAAEAMTEVLKRYPSEAPAVIYYWNSIVPPEAIHSGFDIPAILFDAGLTPDTLISVENKGSDKNRLRSWDISNSIDGAFSSYQAQKISLATPEVISAPRSIRL